MKQLARRIASIVALAFVLSAAANVASAKDDWIRLRSANFVLVGNADPKQMREIAARLEQFRQAFAQLLPSLQTSSTVPTTVLVFKTMKAYGPFRSANSAGHFMSGRDMNYIALTTELKGDQNPFTVIFHEYTHQLLNSSPLRDAPAWFNEGLAEYYSTFRLGDDQRAELGRAIPSHLYTLRKQELLPLATLFAVDHKSPYYSEGQKQTIFYAQSWLLVHYLIQSNKGSHQLQLGQFIDLLLRKTPVEEAFQQAFKTSFTDLERDLQTYARLDNFPATVVTFRQKLEANREVAIESLDDAAVVAYQGDLLFHMHYADAEKYLLKALKLDPAQSRALAALGSLYSENGQFERARPLLERAVAADDRNAYVHYLYADAILKETENSPSLVIGVPPESMARMRASLRSAIVLEPSFTEPYRMLAYLSLLDNEQVEGSITLLQRALTADPGRVELNFMLGQCYLNRRDLTRARSALEIVLKDATTEELRRQAKGILTQIAEMELADRRSETLPSGQAVVPLPGDDQAAEARHLNAEVLALRPLVDGEVRLRGQLVKIECTGGRSVILVVRAGDKEFRFHSADLSQVRFSSFSLEVAGGKQLSCGPFPAPNTVFATYEPNVNRAARLDGDAVAIEFIPPETVVP